MSESFLHYIWQFQYFAKQSLSTSDGEPLQIFFPGHLNVHAGADFTHARICIGALEWVGSIEIHINGSEWFQHRHERDAAYNNVVLHVVWQDDKPAVRQDGTRLPTIALHDRVDPALVLKHASLMNTYISIPCATALPDVAPITILSALDKSYSVRLERKAVEVTEILKRNLGDWEETCYQLLARSFGFKLNADPFLQLARAVPYKVIGKHANNLVSVEALLLGQAGFLTESSENDYIKLLQREYHLLSQKFSMHGKKLHRTQWKFLRLRPANFPTIRIVQFAALLQTQHNLFSQLLEAVTYPAVLAIFRVEQSAYWLQHYQPDKEASEKIAGLGDASIDVLIINTVVPMLFAYGRLHDDDRYTTRAVDILQQIPPEGNYIIRQWQSLSVEAQSAFDSQALIELYTNFCSKHRCLDCNIGASLIKPDPR